MADKIRIISFYNIKFTRYSFAWNCIYISAAFETKLELTLNEQY